MRDLSLNISLIFITRTRDLEQGRMARNGKPTAHSKFGVSRCINSIYFGQVIAWKCRFDHFKVKHVFD